MERSEETLTFVLPRLLAEALQAAAVEEHRPSVEVLQDAVTAYMISKRWNRILDYGKGKAAERCLSEADVPRLIAEGRAKSGDVP